MIDQILNNLNVPIFVITSSAAILAISLLALAGCNTKISNGRLFSIGSVLQFKMCINLYIPLCSYNCFKYISRPAFSTVFVNTECDNI